MNKLKLNAWLPCFYDNHEVLLTGDCSGWNVDKISSGSEKIRLHLCCLVFRCPVFTPCVFRANWPPYTTAPVLSTPEPWTVGLAGSVKRWRIILKQFIRFNQPPLPVLLLRLLYFCWGKSGRKLLGKIFIPNGAEQWLVFVWDDWVLTQIYL